jgi:hypothetical protein
MGTSEQDEETTSISIPMPIEHLHAKIKRGLDAVSAAVQGLDEMAREFVKSIEPEVTILLVEPNASLRRRLTRYFAGIGCIVFECETMDQAEAVLRAHGEVIDRLVFDLEWSSENVGA